MRIVRPLILCVSLACLQQLGAQVSAVQAPAESTSDCLDQYTATRSAALGVRQLTSGHEAHSLWQLEAALDDAWRLVYKLPSAQVKLCSRERVASLQSMTVALEKRRSELAREQQAAEERALDTAIGRVSAELPKEVPHE